MTRKLGALAVCVTAVLALTAPVAQASARKPFHCYWTEIHWSDWSWHRLTTEPTVIHCDRTWK